MPQESLFREDERICVVGLQGSGKTTWTKHYIQEHIAAGHKVLIFDVNHEYNIPGATIYRPKIGSDAEQLRTELETLLKIRVMNPYKVSKKQPYRLLVLDEANRYIEHAKPLTESMRWINDTMRHMKISLLTISRRFVQQHVDMAELAHRLIIYRQTGINDLKRLSELSKGLDIAVESLQQYQYVEVFQDRTYQIKAPVKMNEIKK